MKNVSLYITAGLIAVFLVLIGSIVLLGSRLSKAKARVQTLEFNASINNLPNGQHLALILTYRELLSKDTLKIDSLSKALKIRPKTIIKFQQVIKYVYDTVSFPVFVQKVDSGKWNVTDTGKCWVWKGSIFLKNDSLSFRRTSFEFYDKMTQFFYWQRKKKFLFIHYGAKDYFQKTQSTCGKDPANPVEPLHAPQVRE